jgi:hypothetical protein
MNMNESARFVVFRAKEARSETEASIMEYAPVSSVVTEGGRKAQEAGALEGTELKVLFAMPGFSLTYVWFKSGFPLPRHSHNVDCVYYIVGGSLFMGHDELGVGDGFFVGRDVPYTYRPGPQGVEVLEFRASNAFDIKVLANNPLFWENAAETARNHRTAWAHERRPSSIAASATSPSVTHQ